MNTQPEALRLADRLEGRWALHPEMQEAAAELRRLVAEHEEDQRVIAVWRGRTQRAEAQRDALLAALIGCRDRFFPVDQPKRDRDLMWEPVNAAIKAVEEGK